MGGSFNWCFGDLLSLAGYLFSSDVMATMERYSKELADSVMEKAKRVCRGYSEVGKVMGLI